jgi:clusterin-associated protein 1
MDKETVTGLQTYKDMKELLLLLRRLEYPRALSMQSFRTANFKLTAEILFWLCGKVQANLNISSNINRENERVNFIKNVCRLFSDKFRVKINALNLYAADWRALKELLLLGKVML